MLQIASKIVLQPMTSHCRITECFHYQTELGWVSMSAHKHCRKVNCLCPVCLQHIVTVPQNHGQSREEGFAPNFAVQDAQRHCVFLSSLCVSLTRVDEATAHIVQYCSQCCYACILTIGYTFAAWQPLITILCTETTSGTSMLLKLCNITHNIKHTWSYMSSEQHIQLST